MANRFGISVFRHNWVSIEIGENYYSFGKVTDKAELNGVCWLYFGEIDWDYTPEPEPEPEPQPQPFASFKLRKPTKKPKTKKN